MPYRTTREALRDGREPSPVQRQLGEGLTLAFRPGVEVEPWSHYVAAGFDENGKLQDLQHGAGTVVVSSEQPGSGDRDE